MHSQPEAGLEKENARRRTQNGAGTCDAGSFVPRAGRVMDACCPGASSGGHRRMQADCDLPDTCPSLGCADEALGFAADCRELLGEAEYVVDGIPMAAFGSFVSSCQDLSSGAGQMLEPVTV
eukprot:COSAG04_NODE_21821_length_367_cov_0.395522_1_plen_121_part_11